MAIIAQLLVAFVAVIHLYILVLEMFLWTKPAGRKAFALTPEFAESTRVLAANQGLYNGFLAAGLLWGLCPATQNATAIQLFFLGCVAIAGIYGAATASKKILFIQTVPAVVAAIAVILS